MSRVSIQLDDSRTAELLTVDGDWVELSAEQALAPGTRLAGRLASGHEVRLKIVRCVRDGERFALTGRLVDATRDLRALLGRAIEQRP